MKQLLFLLMALVGFTSCNLPEQSADEKDQDKQEQLQSEATRQVGMPAIHNFQEKKTMKMLYELRDNPNLVNYAYTFSEVTGKTVFLGKCIGYGIPYSAQFSNPEKFIEFRTTYSGYTIPQAEPNGLFMPSSADGTWIMLINPKTHEPAPVYIEPKVIVSPFPLT